MDPEKVPWFICKVALFSIGFGLSFPLVMKYLFGRSDECWEWYSTVFVCSQIGVLVCGVFLILCNMFSEFRSSCSSQAHRESQTEEEAECQKFGKHQQDSSCEEEETESSECDESEDEEFIGVNISKNKISVDSLLTLFSRSKTFRSVRSNSSNASQPNSRPRCLSDSGIGIREYRAMKKHKKELEAKQYKHPFEPETYKHPIEIKTYEHPSEAKKATPVPDKSPLRVPIFDNRTMTPPTPSPRRSTETQTQSVVNTMKTSESQPSRRDSPSMIERVVIPRCPSLISSSSSSSSSCLTCSSCGSERRASLREERPSCHEVVKEKSEGSTILTTIVTVAAVGVATHTLYRVLFCGSHSHRPEAIVTRAAECVCKHVGTQCP